MKLSPSHLISLAAVMLRRRFFRVELDGLLPEAWSLEFESDLLLQISGVSPEINETALPSAEAPSEAGQAALTAGSLAHGQATIHAVMDALQSRGSAPDDDVADQIPSGSLTVINEPSVVRNRRIAVIWRCATRRTSLESLGLELCQRERRNRPAGHVRHNALESHSFWNRLQNQRAGNQCGTRRALQHLLAADFCFRLPTWSFDPGRRGPHAGFLSDGIGR